jgi:hypothetical protein
MSWAVGRAWWWPLLASVTAPLGPDILCCTPGANRNIQLRDELYTPDSIKFRINQETKFLYKKKQHLNHQLFKKQLECPNQQKGMWQHIQNYIDQQINKIMENQYQKLNKKQLSFASTNKTKKCIHWSSYTQLCGYAVSIQCPWFRETRMERWQSIRSTGDFTQTVDRMKGGPFDPKEKILAMSVYKPTSFVQASVFCGICRCTCVGPFRAAAKFLAAVYLQKNLE